MCIIITKHIYKNKIKTNNTQHRICEIHVSRYIFGGFFCGKVCARRMETKTYIQKQNQTSINKT